MYVNQSFIDSDKTADWRAAPQPLRFYSREKIAEKMRAARAVYGMRRTLGAASRRWQPLMAAMEREARLARPADAAPVADGPDALAGLSEQQLRERLLTRSQIVALNNALAICKEMAELAVQLNDGNTAFVMPLPIFHGEELGRFLAAADAVIERQRAIARRLKVSPETEDLSHVVELHEMKKSLMDLIGRQNARKKGMKKQQANERVKA